MSKVCILGIDSLEYNIVEKLDLKNLKQMEYGKTIVPLDKRGLPLSPQVWGSFLTGEIYEGESFESTNPLMKLNSKIKISKIIPKKMKRKIKEKTRDVKSFPELKKTTFMDETKFNHYNVPFVDLHEMESFKKLDQWRRKDISTLEFRNFLEEMYERDKKNMMKIEGNYFGFTNFFDLLQHHFFMDKEYIEKKYRDINSFVGKIKERMEEDYILIIVSDHGADGEGNHSKHGFYSCSKKLDLEKPKITDFYDIIMKILNLPTTKDRKNIENRLKNLGYI